MLNETKNLIVYFIENPTSLNQFYVTKYMPEVLELVKCYNHTNVQVYVSPELLSDVNNISNGRTVSAESRVTDVFAQHQHISEIPSSLGDRMFEHLFDIDHTRDRQARMGRFTQDDLRTINIETSPKSSLITEDLENIWRERPTCAGIQ